MRIRQTIAFLTRTSFRRILLLALAWIIIPISGFGLWIYQPQFSVGEPSTMTVDPEVLHEHVRKLSVDFAPRSYQNKHNIARCADYIRKHFQAAGAVVSSQEYTASSATYENIVAHFGPETGRRVIVGAHYDACDTTPGADDNASGIAGLLELARLIGAEQSPPTLRLDLVAYCTEEPPHFAGTEMGSFQHAQWLAKENVEVAAMICLEMIGYFTDEPNSQSYPLPAFKLIYPSTGNFIGIVGNTQQRDLLAAVKHAMSGASDLPVYSAAIPSSVPGVDFSDHRSYWHFKFPAIMITDMAFYRNTAYHTESDTHDRLDYARMANVVRGVYQAVHVLAWPKPNDK